MDWYVVLSVFLAFIGQCTENCDKSLGLQVFSPRSQSWVVSMSKRFLATVSISLTSYRNISHSHKIYVSIFGLLSNLTCLSTLLLSWSLSNFKAVSWFKLPILENFETSRKLTIRSPVLYLKDSCIIFRCLQHRTHCAASELSYLYTRMRAWWYVHTSNHCPPPPPPRRCNDNFKSVISEHILYIKLISTSCGIGIRWMSKNLEW